MKRPSFQFYPADWKNNAKLRRCSEAARGAWVDILCTLHDSDEYGVSRWPLADLARAAGVPLKLAKELAAKDVLKGADQAATAYIHASRHAGKEGDPHTLVEPGDGPCWYSSRLVRDEWIRQRRGNGTQFTSNNQPPKPTPKAEPNEPPKQGIGERQGYGPTSSSTSTLKDKDKTPHIPPVGELPLGDTASPENPKPKRERGVTLAVWLERCAKAGEKPISEYEPLARYVRESGLPIDFVNLAWQQFKRDFLPGGKSERKLQIQWRRHFQNFVEKNYFKLWYAKPAGDGVSYELTTVGLQAQMSTRQREAA